MGRGRRIVALCLAVLVTVGILLSPIEGVLSRASDTAVSLSSSGWVIDEADLLTDGEEARLESKSEQLYNDHGLHAVIVTTNQFDGYDIIDWEDSLYEAGFGAGAGEGCLMFAVSMAERDWGIASYGTAESIFSAYGRETIGDQVLEDLSDGDYYEAFDQYLTLAARFMEDYEDGIIHSESKPYKSPVPKLPIILGAFIFSLIVALIVVSTWKRAMNTKVLQKGAGYYLKNDSFRLTNRSDLFLYHTVSRTRREKESKRSGGGGGMHSSGHGTSGKF